MNVTAKIGEFVSGLNVSAVPPEVRHKLQACIINGFGIALGSADTPYYRTAARAVACVDGEGGEATLLYTKQHATAQNAAFCNAALFHGRAQEDTCGTVHVGATVIPMLTALLETRRFPTNRFTGALLAAYEVSGMFDAAYGRITAPAGLRATPLFGTLGAAAAASYLMGSSAREIAAALANAAAFTGGTLQAFVEGSDEWRYQVGVAARAGILSAALARAGSVTASNSIEGKAGFVQAFVRQSCDVEQLTAGLGRDWSVNRVTFKPFPVCAFNQTPVTAALAVRGRVRPKEISNIRVRMNPYETSYPGMDSKGPFNSISGTLMSIPFCIATTMIHGVPNMARMMTYDDPAVAGLIKRTSLITDGLVPNLSAIIEIDTTEGTIVHEQFMTPKDYSYDREGASSLARRIGEEHAIPPEVYDRLDDFVDHLPTASIDEVVRLFARPVIATVS